jgi:signal transduction histidine kinase
MRRLLDESRVPALAAVLGGLFFLDSLKSSGGRLLDVAVGVLACVALLARRRCPTLVAAVLVPALALSASALGPTAVALGAVARYRSRRATAAVLGWHAATVVTLFALVAPSRRELWQGVAVVLALDAAAVATGLLVRTQRERAREAEERHRLQLDEARHAERERIAREMHDVLAHRLSLLAVHAGALEVRRSAPAAERDAAGVVRECAYEALEDLRTMLGLLRDDGTDRPQPTLADLPALIEQSRAAGATVTLDCGGADLAAAAPGVGRHAYRVVQEALTNARKHAPGAPVHVRLSDEDTLVVEVTNPIPPDLAATLPGAGAGLVGLRERMRLIGGRLDHGATDGHFTLRAQVPWER